MERNLKPSSKQSKSPSTTAKASGEMDFNGSQLGKRPLPDASGAQREDSSHKQAKTEPISSSGSSSTTSTTGLLPGKTAPTITNQKPPQPILIPSNNAPNHPQTHPIASATTNNAKAATPVLPPSAALHLNLKQVPPSASNGHNNTNIAVPSTTTATAQSSSASSSTTPPKGSKAPKRSRIKKVDGKWILPQVTREQCQEARKLLKTQGMDKFLDYYLPDNPRGSDMLYVVVILGFYSIKFDDDIDDEQNFMKIVKLLQRAMNRVLYMRTRLDDIYTVEHALQQIEKASKILVLTGAGISTSLGIPDFRSSKGIYSQVKHLGLSDPQEVFDLETFREDPTIFYSVAHMILPPLGSYTPLHAFIKLLEDKGKLLRNYTQNIDNLEANVGISKEKTIQCHGSFAAATCQTCRWKIDGSKIFKYIKELELPVCPNCYKEREKRFNRDENYYPRSYGVMKPDITFFGEDLPKKFHDSIKLDVQECDLLICIGTSLKVAPVSEIVNMVPAEVPQILINKDLVEHAEFDVSLLGYCDNVAAYLSNKLGWKLNHPDYEKILNSGLHLEVLDEDVGIYEIKDFNQIEQEIKATEELLKKSNNNNEKK